MLRGDCVERSEVFKRKVGLLYIQTVLLFVCIRRQVISKSDLLLSFDCWHNSLNMELGIEFSLRQRKDIDFCRN